MKYWFYSCRLRHIILLFDCTHNPSSVLFGTAARYSDHRGRPSHWGQTESADCRTQGSPAGSRCGLHRRDGPLWPWENPREGRPCQRGRWVLRTRRLSLVFRSYFIVSNTGSTHSWSYNNVPLVGKFPCCANSNMSEKYIAVFVFRG